MRGLWAAVGLVALAAVLWVAPADRGRRECTAVRRGPLVTAAARVPPAREAERGPARPADAQREAPPPEASPADEDARAAEVERLAAQGQEASLRALYHGDPSPVVRLEVLRVLASDLDLLREAILFDRDADVRRFASEAARLRLPREDIPFLARALSLESDPPVRTALEESMWVLRAESLSPRDAGR